MRKIINFIYLYRLFAIALLAAAVGLTLELSGHKTIAHVLIAAVALIETLPLLWEMYQDIRLGRYGIDILAATAIIVSVLLKQYWAGLVVVLMLTGGRSLEDFAEHRSKSELDALLSKTPQKATLLRKGKNVIVPVAEIKVGDKIIIKPGEVVPVDAEIISGTANFDESSLTGESLPQAKDEGDRIMSGSINIDGAVTAKSISSAEDSQYQQIIKLVKSAAASQAPFVRLADRYSLPFTLSAYAIAIAVWIISGHAIRFLEVIIVATPCPLLLAAPIAIISGMARASRYGIIVKTGLSLERLAEAKIIAFDKTGTLTKGELSVKSVTAFGSHSKEEVIRYAASLEQNSNHVLAEAVVTDAKLRGIKTLKAKHIEEIAGLGVKANVKGSQVLVGNYGLMQRENINIPSSFKQASVTQTAAYLAIGNRLAGVITFADEIRDDAVQTLSLLHKSGITKEVMITGDNTTTAKLIAKQLGIDEVYGEALPADKLHILSKLRPRPVIFVGDGVNDAPVLTAADVGIAMGAGGSTAASESADMVVMQNDLNRVGAGVEIAKKTFQIAKQSILIGIGLSVILMLVFATGKFPPLAGALLQEVVDVFVIFNALRAHMISPSMLS